MVYDQAVAREDGSVLRSVEIRAANPGGFVSGSSVGAQVVTSGGAVDSALSGTAVCGEATRLVSQASGYAKAIYAKNGQRVEKGQLILEIENDNLAATARRAALDKQSLMIKLNSLQEDLASCTIYSPMSGVVTEAKKSAPDSITSDSDSIMTISDISKLVLKLSVSEDDLKNFAEGTVLTLKTDDVRYPELAAAVTEVSQTGRSDNGALVYPVTVTADNPSSLMPGAQATVILP
jgi:multidrug efflux pump subunit AcrA (membrane-fusion protein)